MLTSSVVLGNKSNGYTLKNTNQIVYLKINAYCCLCDDYRNSRYLLDINTRGRYFNITIHLELKA